MLNAVLLEQETPVSHLNRPKNWLELCKAISQKNEDMEKLVIFKAQYEDPEEVLEASESPILKNPLPLVSDLRLVFPGLDTKPAKVFLNGFNVTTWEIAPILDKAARKRSSEVAGMDNIDSGRIKSRRTRTRESLADGLVTIEENAITTKKIKQNPFAETEGTDAWCFSSVDMILSRMDVLEAFGDLASKRPSRTSQNQEGEDRILPTQKSLTSCLDLYDLVANRPESLPRISNVRFSGHESIQSQLVSTIEAMDADQASLSAATSDAWDLGLQDFLDHVSAQRLNVPELCFTIIQYFFGVNSQIFNGKDGGSRSSNYIVQLWNNSLRSELYKLLKEQDAYIRNAVSSLIRRDQTSPESDMTLSVEDLVTMTQNILEFRFDMLVASALPVDALQSDEFTNIEIWQDLVRECLAVRDEQQLDENNRNDELVLRNVWLAATVERYKASDRMDDALNHLNELRDIFLSRSSPIIQLPNNTLAPELSIEIIDRHISKLTTSRFFSKVFGESQDEPAVVIEGLEPLLDHVYNIKHRSSLQFAEEEAVQTCSPNLQELVSFLVNSSDAVTAALWDRLRQAYESIEYAPMVVFCSFRTMEYSMSYLDSDVHSVKPVADRCIEILETIHRVYDVLTKVHILLKSTDNTFDCLDPTRLRSAAGVTVKVLRLLHYFNFAEDEIRLEIRPVPFEKEVSKGKIYRGAVKLLKDTLVSAWTILYLLVIEYVKQEAEKFRGEEFDMQRMEMLRSVHTSVGLRGSCESADRILLHLLKKELPSLKHVIGHDFEFSQVLYDLYDLNCFANPSWELLPHGCGGDIQLDRSTCLQAVDLLLAQAVKMKVGELSKHTLKDAIERVHSVLIRKKVPEAVTKNREILKKFLASPVRPLELIQCLDGHGHTGCVPAPPQAAVVADKGWFALVGELSLVKFKSQKRVIAAPVDDLETAIDIFTQDLEYGDHKWRTWFMLGQTFDAKLEDIVTWNSEKLNNNMDELATLQKSAIHCYQMATALVARSSDPSLEKSTEVADLHSDFAIRLYASSRPPFDMHAFSLNGAIRYQSTKSISEVPIFKVMQPYTVWKLAKALLKRAIACRPDKWFLYFMLGKCLWKMYNASDDHPGRVRLGTSYEEVVQAYKAAINNLPFERKDKKDPILEPHYAIISVVNKLMTKRNAEGELQPAMTLDQASKVLNYTPYVAKVAACTNINEWNSYMLSILKQLRHADKANWHHRLIIRAARIHYNDNISLARTDVAALSGAKHEMTQHLFTKIMALQVWKPEYERPGRHFVYTSRYTRYFIKILTALNDRASIEILARRIRKRTVDFLDHTELWCYLCSSSVKMFRKHGKAPFGYETLMFSAIEYDDFVKRKSLIEEWCQTSGAQNPCLDVIKEAFDLKKLNATLAHPGPLDDLIADTYAKLFDTVGKDLLQAQQVGEGQLVTAAENHDVAMSETHDLMPTITVPDPLTEPPASQEMAEAQELSDDVDVIMTDPIESASAKRKPGIGRRVIRASAEACVRLVTTTNNQQSKGKSIEDVFDVPTREVQIIVPRLKIDPIGSDADDDEDDSELTEVDEDIVIAIEQNQEAEDHDGQKVSDDAEAGLSKDVSTDEITAIETIGTTDIKDAKHTASERQIDPIFKVNDRTPE